jgi:hypothetical protein
MFDQQAVKYVAKLTAGIVSLRSICSNRLLAVTDHSGVGSEGRMLHRDVIGGRDFDQQYQRSDPNSRTRSAIHQVRQSIGNP